MNIFPLNILILASLIGVGFLYRNSLVYKVRIKARDMIDHKDWLSAKNTYYKLPNYETMLYNIRLYRYFTVDGLYKASIGFKVRKNIFW